MKRVSIALLAGLLLTALLPTATTTAEYQKWDGIWTTYGGNGDRFGRLRFNQHADDTVTGTFRYSGGGTITGEVKGGRQRRMVGHYKGRDDSGYFGIEMEGNNERWEGWFKPCTYFCRKRHWSGIRGKH